MEDNISISIGDAVLKVGVDTKAMEKGLKGIGNQIKQHQKAIGIGMAAAGGVILGVLALSIKAAADFETAMREVNTMMGLAEEEFSAFSVEVRELASSMGVSAVESANALYQAISAGIPKDNALEFLRIATEAAIGGVTDTKTAVDGLTTVLNAFKLPLSDTQRVADLMFTTVKGGKTTFEELSASLFQVAPIAAASGVSFEEVSAALATMTKQGVPTTVATTQLRQAMVALQKPTADMDKVIENLGYESGQTMLEELGLAETLNTLRDATGGSNEMLMTMFGSVEAGAAVLALTGDNADTFATDLEAMASSSGAATDAFNEMEKSASRQMKRLEISARGIATSIGVILLPILKDLLDKIKPVIEGVIAWTKEHPGLTKAIVIGAAALGSLLVALGGVIMIAPAVGAAFHIMLGPIGLITLAVTALIAVGVLLWKNWDKVVNFFLDAWSFMKIAVLENVRKMLGALKIFLGWIPGFGDKIKEAHDAIANMIEDEELSRDIRRVKREMKALKESTEEVTAAIVDPGGFIPAQIMEQEVLATSRDAVLAKKDAIKELGTAYEKTGETIEEVAAKEAEGGPPTTVAGELAFGKRVATFEAGRAGRVQAAWEQFQTTGKGLSEVLGAAILGLGYGKEHLRGLGGVETIGDLGREIERRVRTTTDPRFRGAAEGQLWDIFTGQLAKFLGPDFQFRQGRETANITVELDGRTIAQVIAAPLVDEIRVRQAVKL